MGENIQYVQMMQPIWDLIPKYRKKTAHTAQQQKNKKLNQKMDRRPR